MLGIKLGVNVNNVKRIAKSNIQLVKSSGGTLYLDARKATGLGLPSNSPLTSPWVDLSGDNANATLANFGSTTASGYDISVPSKPLLIFDGVDDYLSLANTSYVDITTPPLAVFTTIKTPSTMTTGYVVCKNTSSSSDIQYAILINADGSISIALEGAGRKSTSAGTLLPNKYYDIGFLWDGVNVKIYVNQVQIGTSGAYSVSPLTSRLYMAIGQRNTGSVRFKGGIGIVTIYAGIKCTESNILATQRIISSVYLN